MKIANLFARQAIQLCLFLIAAALFIWPFLAAPCVAEPKAMFLYLFSAWSLILLAVFFISRACRERPDPDKAPSREID